ncbi:MAG: PAS domain S-box protein [Candidatus Obscuribacterales bacterium]|nr:PAS domain S-box protein [Candidatus Obscuribacterales bacterium]
MRTRISLTTKVLLFVSVPLLIQLGLLAALAHLQKEAEDALQASAHSKAVSDKIHEIISDIFNFSRRYRSNEALENTPLDDDIGRMLAAKVWRDYDDLKEITKSQPEIYSTVIASERTTRQALELYRVIKEAWNQRDQLSHAEKVLLARRMRQGKMDKIVNQLVMIADEQRRVYDKAPEEQGEFRKRAQTIMIALGIFDLALGVFLALFLTRGITTRLQKVSENTTNLAAGVPLHPLMEGNDEIANLDQVFHKMAIELKEAARKERAVVENAVDFICTLDANNRLVAANPASTTLLGMEPGELVGKYAIELVSETDKNKATDFFARLKEDEISASVELELITAGKESIDTSWSAHWSKAEDSIFCVVHDISERRRIEKLKQEVTAMITHDLRSPLNTVVNVLDFFERLTADSQDERVDRYVSMGRRNTDRMLSLINDLLDIEKIKSGNMNVEIKDFSLGDCFLTCEELTAAAAEEVGVNLDFTDCDTRVSADQNLIDRVLTNLVSNAIRYSPKGKAVQIFCKEEEGDFATIAVKDEGQGIPEDELPTVFERFKQLKSGGAKNKGGSGLGLTICKAIVEMHGGKIWAESAGQGSTFLFTIPLSKN